MKKYYVKPTNKSVVLEMESLLNTISGGEQGTPGASGQGKKRSVGDEWEEEWND